MLKFSFNIYGGLKYWVGKKIVTFNLSRQFNYDYGSCNDKNRIILQLTINNIHKYITIFVDVYVFDLIGNVITFQNKLRVERDFLHAQRWVKPINVDMNFVYNQIGIALDFICFFIWVILNWKKCRLFGSYNIHCVVQF